MRVMPPLARNASITRNAVTFLEQTRGLEGKRKFFSWHSGEILSQADQTLCGPRHISFAKYIVLPMSPRRAVCLRYST